MHNIVSIVSIAILSAHICQAAQVANYDFSGDLSAHFTAVPPPMGAGATFVQSAGSMLFHNASTNARMEVLEHKHFKPRADHDWQVSIDASVPLVYDTSPPPNTNHAWIELAVYVQYVDAAGNLHSLLNALGIDSNLPGGPNGRTFAPAEMLMPAGNKIEKIPHDHGDLSTTNETANLQIAYNHTNATLSAGASGRELLTISVTGWQLGANGRFDLLVYGHSENHARQPSVWVGFPSQKRIIGTRAS